MCITCLVILPGCGGSLRTITIPEVSPNPLPAERFPGLVIVESTVVRDPEIVEYNNGLGLWRQPVSCRSSLANSANNFVNAYFSQVNQPDSSIQVTHNYRLKLEISNLRLDPAFSHFDMFVSFRASLFAKEGQLLLQTVAEGKAHFTGYGASFQLVWERAFQSGLQKLFEEFRSSPVVRTYAATVPQGSRLVQKVEGTLTATIGQRHAVVIGVAKYRAAGELLLPLQYAAKDAEEFRDFLTSPAGGSFPASQVVLLTNEQATSVEIRKALFTFLKSAIKEDLVVIFFSGHGAADPDRPGNLYLLSYDTDPNDIAATAFPMDDVQKALRNTIEAQRVVVLTDACHSGGVAQSMKTKGVRLGSSNEAVNKYWSALSETGPGRVIFTSSERGEVSQESAAWGGGHGVFTWALLEGLRGAADSDKDGIVTLGETLRFTNERVRRETKSAQHPTIAGENYDPK